MYLFKSRRFPFLKISRWLMNDALVTPLHNLRES